MKPLRNLVVVVFAGSMAGAYCAKMFADGGAHVMIVGQSNLGPHKQSYLYANAQPVAIDDIDLATVDVVIESAAPRPLTPRVLDAPHLVRLQISPFGMSGDHASWLGTDLTDYAASGHAYLYGDPEREPLRGPPDQPAVAAGLYGFVGTMAALLARDRLGHGQTVEISHVQVMAALHQVTLLRWFMTGDVFCRMGNRYTGQGQPNGPYRCNDGWISITAVTGPQVEGLLAVTGLLELLDRPDIDSVMDFQRYPAVLDEPLNEWLSTRPVTEVVDLFQAMRIPAAPLLDPLELLEDPQLVDRAFFEPLASDRAHSVPGPPFQVSHEQPGGNGTSWQPGSVTDGPLAGLRVLDLARVWAGPMCGRILSDLGADVIWIEAPWHRGPQSVPPSLVEATRFFPNDDPGERQWNRNTHFVKYALGKRSLALDLQTDVGQDVLARLVPDFHVLLENFSSRVMPQLGFDEVRLHELNPDLLYLTMPGYGRSGPAEHWLAYGSSVDSHAGLSSLIGYADQTPWKGGIAWPDPIAGLHATSAVLSQLWSGLTHGTGGATIEAAQFESTVAAIGDRILEAQIDGPFRPNGNRDDQYLAQGIYRCIGDDEWIAVSIIDQAALVSLCDLLDLGLEADAPFDHDAFDLAFSAVTSEHDANELAILLQAHGLAASKVAKAPDLAQDPHLQSRSSWGTVDQPEVGPFTVLLTPIAMSATPIRSLMPAPTLGEHNDAVLHAAGFSRTEIVTLAADGIIVTEPPN
ncbi:MAG: CoA transferase [Acidimicrobiales bacterium]|jgi:crotonobetainyl-CoA:carnitine CoA-transferase CaiB-like acyl-CoA transferase